MENSDKQLINGIELIKKELDLFNVKYFNYEIVSNRFWNEQFYDKFKLHYKQWWKIPKVIKIKRDQKFTYPNGNCDIERITHRHSEESLILLMVLENLSIPCIKI